MAGVQTPLVLVPRYTTYCGVPVYSTIAMDVTAYENAIVNIFRSAMIGTAGNPLFNLQESTDQVTWSTCGGTSLNFNPTAGSETQYTAALTKRWFRITVTLPNADNLLTCYAVGFLEERQS
jgi:hypothetical protein